MATQLEQLTAILGKLDDAYPGLVESLDQLGAVLGRAQFRPPCGEADGSVDRASWSEARVVHASLAAFLHSLPSR